MGVDLDAIDKSEECIDLKIQLEKLCYFPGELVTGNLTLTPKPGLKIANLPDPRVFFNITQYQQYTETRYDGETCSIDYIKKDEKLLDFSIYYSNFSDANILIGLTIPFNFQIPIKSLPTCFIEHDVYCKHYFTVWIPSIKMKRSKIIIIKNIPYYNLNNKLYKSPATVFKYVDKMGFFSKKGKIAAFLKIPKNMFNYNEVIPFEVVLNCTELNLKINGIEAYITRNCRKHDKRNYKVVRHSNETIITSKDLKFIKDAKCFIINNNIQFPKTPNYYPPKIYEICDSQGIAGLNKQFKHYSLYPCSYKGLITISYYLNVKIKYDSSIVSNDLLSMPLNFHSSPQIIKEESINQYPQKGETDESNKINQINNINNINDPDNNNNFYQSNPSINSAPPAAMIDNLINTDKGEFKEDKKDENIIIGKNNITDTGLSFEVIDEKSFYEMLTKENTNNVNK